MRWEGLYPIVLIGLSTLFIGTEGQYDDTRCKCVCPDPNVLFNNASQGQPSRKLYIGQGTKCSCEDVVVPKVEPQPQGKDWILQFCPRCECKYESRNTEIIKRVVIIVIGIVSLLMTYMLFLLCLDPLLNKRIKSTAYQEHTNEDDESVGGSRTSHSLRMTSQVSATASGPGGTSSVLNRVGHQQNKWKRQVQEQRRNIYDRHTMLN